MPLNWSKDQRQTLRTRPPLQVILKTEQNKSASGEKSTATVTKETVLGETGRLNMIAYIALMVVFVTMVYGPIAAFLVELFPTRIRYTSMSLPYHIGNGVFGGMLPLTAAAMVAANGNIYSGLWYPTIVAGVTFVIGTLFIRETKDHKIHTV